MNELNSEKLKPAVNYLDTWLDFNFRNSQIPGMQIAIQHGDEIIYSRAFGYADTATNQELTTKNIFRVASHSKTFTATAIMQLVEAGKLNLDDKMSEHLDWFTSPNDERVAGVTARQLMNHTAGIVRDGIDTTYWQLLRDFPKDSELIEFVSKSKLIYDSDTRFKYSNYGYGFLGLLIAKVSGVPYREYVTTHIVEKLGLGSTGPNLDEKAHSLLATGYGQELFHRKRRVFEHVDTYDLSSATGFYSNAEDLCRYFAAHFMGNTTLLSDASKRMMQHGYWETRGDNEKYGLGMVSYSMRGWNVVGHSGGFPGFVSNTDFDADKKIVVSVLINSYGSNAGRISRKIINILDTFQQNTDWITLPIKDVSKFEGRYYSTWGPTDIVAVGKKLFAVEPLFWTEFDEAEELEVVDYNTLLISKASGYSSVGENIIYTFDKDGKAKSFTYAGRQMLKYDDAVKKGWF